MLYTLSLHNVMSNIFQLKNLNIQSIVHHFYFNSVKKEQLLRKLKGKLEIGKKQKQISWSCRKPRWESWGERRHQDSEFQVNCKADIYPANTRCHHCAVENVADIQVFYLIFRTEGSLQVFEIVHFSPLLIPVYDYCGLIKTPWTLIFSCVWFIPHPLSRVVLEVVQAPRKTPGRAPASKLLEVEGLPVQRFPPLGLCLGPALSSPTPTPLSEATQLQAPLLQPELEREQPGDGEFEGSVCRWHCPAWEGKRQGGRAEF